MSNKEKIVVMTAKEIRAKYPITEEDRAMFRAAPEYDGDPSPRGKRIGRGFAAFKEYINRKGRPKAEVKRITIGITLPENLVVEMRQTDGYSRMISDYVMDGINRGKLRIPTLRKQA